MGRTTNRRAAPRTKKKTPVKTHDRESQQRLTAGERSRTSAHYFNAITAFYEEHHDCGHEHPVSTTEIEALDFSRWDAIIDRIAKDLHSGKIKPSDLDQEAINQTYNELSDAGQKGYGKEWNSFPADGKGSVVNELKQNLYQFSGAKSYAMLEHLNHLLYDQNGKLRPFNEYEVYARKLNRQYNRNWLQAEWQTARTAAQMAEKWQRIQETKDLFPNLEYRTVGDDRVRDEHKEMNGIIRPIDDAFWNEWFPPSSWRCRCDAVPTAAKATDLPEKLPEPTFKGNVGKDGEIFTKKHNFFKLLAKNENAERNQELFKLNAPSEVVYKGKNGKKVYRNIFYDKDDYPVNLNSAKKIVDKLKIDVYIRADIDTNIALGFKNAEYFINGYLSDLKSQFKNDNYNAIKNAFKAAREQNLESIVFDFTSSFKKLNLTEVNRQILSQINEKRGKQFKELIFIYKDKAIQISRKKIVNKELREALEKLKTDS